MTGYFIFDDIDTRNYEGIVVVEDDIDSAPERMYEEITVPGRNGTLLIDMKRYDNVVHSYDVIVYEDYLDNLVALRNALMSKVGYKTLVDSFNPEEKYYAYVYIQLSPKQGSYHRDGGTFHIEFSRKPQRFLLSGDVPMEISEIVHLTDHNLEAITDHNGNPIDVTHIVDTITNPTLFESKPLIVAYEPCTIRISNQTITVGGDGSLPIYIDCDSMQIYTINASGAIVNASDKVTFSPRKFPVFPSGDVSFFSSTVSLEFIPRWWIL